MKIKYYLLVFFVFISDILLAQQWVWDEIAEERSESEGLSFSSIVIVVVVIGLLFLYSHFQKPNKESVTVEDDAFDYDEEQDREIDIVEAQRISDDILEIDSQKFGYEDKEFDIESQVQEDYLQNSCIANVPLHTNDLMKSNAPEEDNEEEELGIPSWIAEEISKACEPDSDMAYGDYFEEPDVDVDFSSLRTLRNENIESCMETIDLGLSVLWSSCNLGANNPEEYGNYFAWGEIVPCESWSPHMVYKLQNKTTEELKEILGNDSVSFSGNPKYDAATYKLGSGWRIPNRKELEELFVKCSWELTEQKSVKGYKATGPNGNSIFIPLAGRWCIDKAIMTGDSASLYSSEPYVGQHVPGDEFAYYLLLQNFAPPYDSKITSCARKMSQTMRPVRNR